MIKVHKNLIDTDDLSDIMEEVISIKSSFYPLGRALRLQISDLEDIQAKYPSPLDADKALEKVLLLWLNQKYNTQRFGCPTWKILTEAVYKETGGNNPDLAKRIASNHPAG